MNTLQWLDTTALVLCLVNMALQFIGMMWLLAECIRLTHLRALANLPGRAASGLSSSWRSFVKGGISSLSRRRSKGVQAKGAGGAVEEEQQQKGGEEGQQDDMQLKQQQADQGMLQKAKGSAPAVSLDTQCDGKWLGHAWLQLQGLAPGISWRANEPRSHGQLYALS